jgi:1-acyl-sn-glycerol-3-phosphate acyltransferase
MPVHRLDLVTGALRCRVVHVSKAYLAIGALSWPLLKGLLRITSRGREKLPEGGFVLSANHHSNVDHWALGFALFPRRQVRFMGKAELFKPVLGSILRSAGAFPVRRGEGEIVAIYPEGTRREKGIKKRRKAGRHTGAARVALTAGVPLVPAAIGGTERLSQFPRVQVIYGDPIPLDDLAGQDTRSASLEATERLFSAIAELEQQL